MNEMAEAFEEMLDAQEDVLGERVTCKIDSKTVDFLADDVGVFEEFMEGGEAQAGAIEGKVRLSDFPNGRQKFKTFEFRGKSLQILNVRRVNSTLHITAGDPAAEDV